MLTSETKIRVRYDEADRMGYLHHAVYAVYLEIARTEMLRDLGTSYRELEDKGILLPVYSLTINYKLPAFYDDELTIISNLKMLPVVKLIIDYEILNQEERIICTASSANVFINASNRKPVRAPEVFLEKFNSFFSEND